MTQLCGDPTCESFSCSDEAIRKWEEQQERDARQIVDYLIPQGDSDGQDQK